MTNWQELTIHVHRDAEEAVSNLMIETGSQGVAISDSADYVGQEDRFGELYPEVEHRSLCNLGILQGLCVVQQILLFLLYHIPPVQGPHPSHALLCQRYPW